MLCGQASPGRPTMAFTVQQSWEHCHLPSVFNKSTTVQQSWKHYATGHAEQQSCYSSQYSTVQLRVLGWEHYSKHGETFMLPWLFGPLSWECRSTGQVEQLLCCSENFLPTHTSKVWNKNFLNVNIGGKASKKLKSGSKMVCSCHLVEQQLLSGFDG